MAKEIKSRIQQKHDIEANWKLAVNFIPKQGEIIIYDIDDNYDYERFKIGDGVTNINDLPFALGDLHPSDFDNSSIESKNSSVEFKGYFIKAINFVNKYIILTNERPSDGLIVVETGLANSSEYYRTDLLFADEFVNKTIFNLNLYGVTYFNVELTRESETGNAWNFTNFPVTAEELEEFRLDIDDKLAEGRVVEQANYIWNIEASKDELTSWGTMEGVDLPKAESFAFGHGSKALQSNSFAAGERTIAQGKNSAAFGRNTLANKGAFTAGYGNIAEGDYSLAIGGQNIAKGTASAATGNKTLADGDFSFAEGRSTGAYGHSAHAEGWMTVTGEGEVPDSNPRVNSDTTPGYFAHAEGNFTRAKGNSSHAEGRTSQAEGIASHAEGWNTVASGARSHSEGSGTKAEGFASHAEGHQAIASGQGAHAEGARYVDGEKIEYYTIASAEGAHAEGRATTASGDAAHAEGDRTVASGSYSHSEGALNTVSAYAGHAEGSNNTVEGTRAHAEGRGNKAIGEYSHAEGNSTEANGARSHAEGSQTKANGYASHASGRGTIANATGQMVTGNYNKENANALFIVGNGTGPNEENRSNAFEVTQDKVLAHGKDVVATSIITSDDNGKVLTVKDGAWSVETIENTLIVTVSNTTPSHTSQEIYEATIAGKDVYLYMSGTTYIPLARSTAVEAWFVSQHLSTATGADGNSYSVVNFTRYSIIGNIFKHNGTQTLPNQGYVDAVKALIVTVNSSTPSHTSQEIFEASQAGKDVYLYLWGTTYIALSRCAAGEARFSYSYTTTATDVDGTSRPMSVTANYTIKNDVYSAGSITVPCQQYVDAMKTLIVTVSGTTPSHTSQEIFEASQAGKDVFLDRWGTICIPLARSIAEEAWFQSQYISTAIGADGNTYSVVKYAMYIIEDNVFKQKDTQTLPNQGYVDAAKALIVTLDGTTPSNTNAEIYSAVTSGRAVYLQTADGTHVLCSKCTETLARFEMVNTYDFTIDGTRHSGRQLYTYIIQNDVYKTSQAIVPSKSYVDAVNETLIVTVDGSTPSHTSQEIYAAMSAGKSVYRHLWGTTYIPCIRSSEGEAYFISSTPTTPAVVDGVQYPMASIGIWAIKGSKTETVTVPVANRGYVDTLFGKAMECVGSVTVVPYGNEVNGEWYIGDAYASNSITGNYNAGSQVHGIISSSDLLMIEYVRRDGEHVKHFGSVGYGFTTPKLPQLACEYGSDGFYIAQEVADTIFETGTYNSLCDSVMFTGYKLPTA